MTIHRGRFDQVCINTIRFLAVDAVEQAKSGHPGMPMGCAAIAYVLWTKFLRHNPANPNWPGRDRFVLSAGHGSALLYSMLHLTGYDLPLEELKRFRQWGSRTPGHPEFRHTPGVETTTGPLGQGLGNAVGMAIAERYCAAYFNRPGFSIIDNYTYVLVSDGDLMEGISHEAASLAGHLGLGRLICLWDDNDISIEGSTGLAFTEDVMQRFTAYGWHVQKVEDGNSVTAIAEALSNAREVTDKPSLIAVRTLIGCGSPNKAGSAAAHGEPLGPGETRLAKENMDWPVDSPFFIPDEALTVFRQAVTQGQILETQWQDRFGIYRQSYPELAAEYDEWLAGTLPAGWDESLPVFVPDAKGMATRNASGEILNAAALRLPNLLGGSADLAPSTKTLLKDGEDFSRNNFSGRNLRFGVREHAMGAIANGISLYGGLIPYCGTFLIFSDYMRPALRLAALMRLKVIYVFTHDSIGLGEDGPTHQPVEHLPSLRAIPGLTVFRPADANETIQAWRYALSEASGPTAIVLSRQSVPVLPASEDTGKGAYIAAGGTAEWPDAILIASGSEVSLAIQAGEELQKQGVQTRVVSMPSWEIFERQSKEYRDKVLPPQVKTRIAIEAASPFGWEKYTLVSGAVIGVNHFGASAPYQDLYREFGLTVDNIVKNVKEIKGKQQP